MKKITLILITLAAILCANANDGQYKAAMEEAIASLEAAESTGETIALRNRFEMISKAYPTEWLPFYYVALCDLQAVFMNPRSEDAAGWLDDAKKYLDITTEKEGADQSEIRTLYGYYYMGLITTNQSENAQKYFTKPTEEFNKAIELNPENPRPLLLRAFYVLFLPDFVRPDIDREGDLTKAGELLAAETADIDKPFWGAGFYNALTGQ